MYSTRPMNASTGISSEQAYERLKEELARADMVVVGAGAGLSTAAGLTYSGERFENNFADFIAVYHCPDMYTAGFYPYPTLEEQWAYWSRYIDINRYAMDGGAVYKKLLELLEDTNYFVLTTNTDHTFQRAGIDRQRLFYTQGDLGLWQCSKPCHQKTYDNEEAVKLMVAQQKDMRIPSELIPYCPTCGSPMRMNLRNDDAFVENEGWHAAAQRYSDFIEEAMRSHALFLELGVGGNTPGIIKYPFWRMVHQNPKATYLCINKDEAFAPEEIEDRSICIAQDIDVVFQAQ